MSGTLFHSKEFRTEAYVGNDGLAHFEVLAVDGDSTILSHSSWREMREIAEQHGMPRSAWPEFLDFDLGIDVPLDKVRAKQVCFRSYLLQLSPSILKKTKKKTKKVSGTDKTERLYGSWHLCASPIAAACYSPGPPFVGRACAV